MARRLIVEIIGNADSLSSSLAKATRDAETFGGKMAAVGSRMTSVGKSMTTGITLPIVAIGALSIKAAMDAETSTARLDTAFKDAGLSAKQYAGQIDNLENRGRNLGFTNTQIKQSMGSLVLATGQVSGSIKDVGIAEDLARFKGVGLEQATKALTMAHAGSLRPLKQLGIDIPKVTAAQDALKLAHVNTKTAAGMDEVAHAKLEDKMATFAKVLDVVSQKTRGQAQAYSETAAGGMARFRAELENIAEKLGSTLLPIFDRLLGYLSQLVNWFDGLSGSTKKWIEITAGIAAAIGPAVAIIGTLVTAVSGLSTAFTFLAANPVFLVIGALALFAGAVAAAVLAPQQFEAALEKMGVSAGTAKTVVTDLQTAFQDLKAVFEVVKSAAEAVWPVIKATIVGNLQLIEGVVKVFSDLLKGDWSKLWSDLKSLVASQINAIVNVAKAEFGLLVSALTPVWNAVKSAAVAAWSGIQSALSTVWNTLKGAASTAASTIAGAFEKGWGGIKTAATGVWNGITSALTAIWNGLKRGAITAALALIEPFTHIPSNLPFVGGWVKSIQALKRQLEGELGKTDLKGKMQGAANKVPPVIAGLSGPMGAEGRAAGEAAGQGLAAGLTGQIGAVRAAASALSQAGVVTPIHVALKTKSPSRVTHQIGRDVAQGLINGMREVTNGVMVAAGGLAQALVAAIERNLVAGGMKVKAAVVEAFRVAAEVQPAIEAAGRVLGEAHARAIAMGILQGSPTLAQQMKQALSQAVQQALTDAQTKVTDAKSAFETAFGNLASAALAAFDDKVSAWVSPAQKLLDKMNLADLEKQIGDALGPGIEKAFANMEAAFAKGNEALAAKIGDGLVKTLQAQLAAANAALATGTTDMASAQAELTAAQASGDQAAITAAQAKVQAAQAEIDAANNKKAAITAALQEIAKIEQTAYDEKMARDRLAFEQQLNALRGALENRRITHAQFEARLQALLKKYVPDYVARGKEYGDALAIGLRNSKKNVEGAIGDLIDAFKKLKDLQVEISVNVSTGGAPGKALGGPVMAGTPYLVGEQGPELFMPSASGRIVPNNQLSAVPIQGGGTQVIQLLLEKRVLAEVVRSELGRLQHRNYATAF